MTQSEKGDCHTMPRSEPARERLILECILWKLATGAAWYEFPEVYPFCPPVPKIGGRKIQISHQTIYRRYRKWLKTGLLIQVSQKPRDAPFHFAILSTFATN